MAIPQVIKQAGIIALHAGQEIAASTGWRDYVTEGRDTPFNYKKVFDDAANAAARKLVIDQSVDGLSERDKAALAVMAYAAGIIAERPDSIIMNDYQAGERDRFGKSDKGTVTAYFSDANERGFDVLKAALGAEWTKKIPDVAANLRTLGM